MSEENSAKKEPKELDEGNINSVSDQEAERPRSTESTLPKDLKVAKKNSTSSIASPRTTDRNKPGGPSQSSPPADEPCVVCFKNVDIYSVGECDHPVCYECSTRMRVLCQQNECPICRQMLNKVIFTHKKLPYRDLEAHNRSVYYNKKYKISFATNYIQQAFYRLLDHPCPKCDVPPYRNFRELSNHVRREHDMYYCDLCVEHLKIFTFERSCYTQTELGLHSVKGDANNKSHRGHPLCEFCKKRFLDRDELFRHSRREHFFCHFCDSMGRNEFYRDYDALADHFRQEHYLCEEGRCATEQFIGAFRTEIDYKAHVANVHGKNMNKQQAKQTRTLQLEITLGPRGRAAGHQNEQSVADVRSRTHQEEQEDSYVPQTSTKTSIDAHNEEEFPSLGGVAATPNLTLAPPLPPAFRNTRSALARTQDNFPSLGSSTAAARPHDNGGTAATRIKANYPPLGGSNAASIRTKENPASSAKGNSALARTQDNFPALGGGGGGGGGGGVGSKAQAKPAPMASLIRNNQSVGGNSARNPKSNGVVLHVSNRPNASQGKPTGLEFPALPLGGQNKKQNRKLYEDLPNHEGAGPAINQVVPAKHRQLVDDYVSVANPIHFQKLQLVQKEEAEAKRQAEANKKKAPKLNNLEFPSLGGGADGANAPVNGASSWAKLPNKKQRELENRKNKVAPPPLAASQATPEVRPFHSKPITPLATMEAAKKEKQKNKDKKEETKLNGKVKENNNNNNNKNHNLTNNHNEERMANRPPPGFAGSQQLQEGDMRPPPGFQSNVTLNSVAKSPNDLTFTTSMGESYSITSSHLYEYPPDATARNMKLVNDFKETLKTPQGLDQFRLISQKFRDNEYKPLAYYEHCQVALKDKFPKVFPELLALLPDISKQQALYLVHQQHLNKLPAAEKKLYPKLSVCSTCKQILQLPDVEAHEKSHNLKTNFPSLNSLTASNSGSNAKNASTDRK